VSARPAPVLDKWTPAFERIVGRKPTEEENREALAIASVVEAADLDPVLLFLLADQRAREDRKRQVDELRQAVKNVPRPIALTVPAYLASWSQVGAVAIGALLTAATAWWVQAMAPHHLPGVLELVAAMVFGGLAVVIFYEVRGRR
jgi:hypothetical protein